MQEKMEILKRCPISKSSNHDEYNDICKATGQQCPYYIDEGMSVCKSKIKCLTYFSKRWSDVNYKQVLKLILSNTQPKNATMTSSSKGSKVKSEKHIEESEKATQSPSEFLAGLEEALKNHEGSAEEDDQEEVSVEDQIMAIEESMKKM